MSEPELAGMTSTEHFHVVDRGEAGGAWLIRVRFIIHTKYEQFYSQNLVACLLSPHEYFALELFS